MTTRFFNFIKQFWLILFIISGLAFIVHYFTYQVPYLHKPLYFHWSFFLITLISQAIYWMITSVTWQKMVFMVCQVSIPLWQSFFQLALVTVGKYIPGKIWGMVARATYMQQIGVSVTDVIILTLQEQFLLLHASLIISAFLLTGLTQSLWAWSFLGLMLLSLFIANPIQRIGLFVYYTILHLLGKSYQIQPVGNLLTTKQYFYLATAYILIWIIVGCIFGGLYFTCMQDSFDITLLGWLILANTLGITLGFFALFAPGGIGVRESISSVILLQVMPLEQAIFINLVFRLWMVGTELASGIVVGLFGFKSFTNAVESFKSNSTN